MPIVFAPPDPLMPAVSAGIGYQQQTERNNQYALQVQQQQAQQQAQQQRLKMESDRQQWEASQFTQANQLELQRLQNGLAMVDARDDLLPDQKDDLKFQLWTKIDPYRQRQERAQQEQEKVQTQRLQEQYKNEAAHNNTVAQLGSQTLDQRTKWVVNDPAKPDYDPAAESHGVITHPDGKESHFVRKPTGRTGQAGWTDHQIDQTAHAQTVADPAYPQWAANPDAARAHPDYLPKYSAARQRILGQLFEAETWPDPDGSGRWHKSPTGEWKKTEDKLAQQQAKAEAKVPIPATRQQAAEEKVLKDLTSGKSGNEEIGTSNSFDHPDGTTWKYPDYRTWKELPDWVRRQEAHKRVRQQIQDLTGVAPPEQAAPPAAPAAPAAPRAPAPLSDAVQRANEIRKARGLSPGG